MRPYILSFVAILAAAPAVAQSPPARGQSGVVVIVSPDQAVSAALARSPVLRSAEASRQAVRGDALQAPLRPNPEASLSVENFGGIGGRGEYRGGRSSESTLGISQRIELGGKRSARVEFASRNGDMAALDYEAARLDLARDVVAALAEAVATARNVTVEQERLQLAIETVRISRGRVEAGREPLLQSRRAEVTRATAEIAVERARREADVALRSLALLIGSSAVELAPRQSWFDNIGPTPRPPLPADPFARTLANPDLAKLDVAVTQQRANLALQRANAVPDVTVSGSVRRFEASRETAFVASVSIPLPVSDRNQGGIARAQAELLRAEVEAERGRLTLATSLTTAERQAELAWRTAQRLRRDALPAAEQAARLASGGFAEGKFTFLEVLDAQRALSDTRSQLNDVRREFHARRAEVERLRGQQPGGMSAEGIQ